MGREESSSRVASALATQVVQAKANADRLEGRLAREPLWRWRRRRALAEESGYWRRKEDAALAMFDEASESSRPRSRSTARGSRARPPGGLLPRPPAGQPVDFPRRECVGSARAEGSADSRT